jgi:sugar O-acyltransferase (sialic acid O-acetyltransferase NeuD family)
MLVIGAKGFAKEIFEVLCQCDNYDNVAFYDDQSTFLSDLFEGVNPILNNEKKATSWFIEMDNTFCLGIGSPRIRRQLAKKFETIGGKCVSVISPFAVIGQLKVSISEGTCIMTNVIITSNVTIGKGCLLNIHSSVGHDSILGDFVELSPGARVSGNCEIGECSVIGTNAVVLPNVKVGANVIVGAGAVVTKDVPQNAVVVGVPAKIIRYQVK